MSQQIVSKEEVSILENHKILDWLEEIRNDTLQITELESEEKKLIGMLSSIIKKMLRHFNLILHVSPTILSKECMQVTESLLNKKGELVLKYEDESVDIKDLEECSAELIMRIFVDTVPQLKEAVAKHKQEMLDKIDFLNKVVQTTQSIGPVVDELRQGHYVAGEQPPEDVVREILQEDNPDSQSG